MSERSMGEITVNGRSYRKPSVPTVVVCYDGCDPRYISHGVAAGVFPNISRIMAEGFFAIADAAMPTFTESEQHVDRDRGAAEGARHFRQLLSRQGDRPGGDDHRRLAGLLGNNSGGACRCRRAGGGDQRQGQAAKNARQRPQGDLFLLRARARGDAPGERGRGCRAAGRAFDARHVQPRSLAVRAGCGDLPLGIAPRRCPLFVTVGLGPAQRRARRGGGG